MDKQFEKSMRFLYLPLGNCKCFCLITRSVTMANYFRDVNIHCSKYTKKYRKLCVFSVLPFTLYCIT